MRTGLGPDSALAAAAYYNNLADLKRLIATQEIDEQDLVGRTALHWAALGKRQDAIDILLKAGCDTSIIDSYGKRFDEYISMQPTGE
jgi:ankyrin repeat protein